MTDITQKLIESDGLTEIKDGETFDLLRLSRSRERVTVHSGGISIDVDPQRRNDEPWYLVFNWLLTAVGDTWFENDTHHKHKASNVFSTDSALFAHPELGLASKLTHVFVTGGSHNPVDD
ncbi:hypothetical protein EON76_03835 [bacterium]|nr:MAG: hypothetical protein EON76_03835 [bacterium]